MAKLFDLFSAQTQIASLSTAQTVTVPAGATGIVVQARGKNIYYTVDGQTPSAALGFLLVADADEKLLPFTAGTAIKFVEAAASATLIWLAVREREFWA